MRTKSSDLAPEFRRQANSNVRAKDAPESLRSAKEALEAFDRVREYRRLELNAHTTCLQRSGSATGRLAAERSEKYDAIADAWEAVLEAWIKAQGQ